MFRRRAFLGRRPRFLLGALAAGFGYAAGRSRGRAGSRDASRPGQLRATDQDHVARLDQLADLHDRGKLTDEEFSAAKRELLGI